MTAAGGKLRVLVVDDDPQISRVISMALHGKADVETTADTIGVTNHVRRFRPHVVLVDYRMPAVPGDRLIKLARSASPTTKFVLFSAADPEELRRVADACGADTWLSKSINFFDDLLPRLEAISRGGTCHRS